MKIIQQWFRVRENSPRAIVTLLNFLNGSSPILSIAGPASKHLKEKRFQLRTETPKQHKLKEIIKIEP